MKSKSDINTPISVLKAHVKDFIEKRDWQKYHNPKDIAIAINVEAAELLDIFKWRKSGYEKDRIEEEVADIAIYLLSLANVVSVDLTKAILGKLKRDEVKYPVGEPPRRWVK